MFNAMYDCRNIFYFIMDIISIKKNVFLNLVQTLYEKLSFNLFSKLNSNIHIFDKQTECHLDQTKEI